MNTHRNKREWDELAQQLGHAGMHEFLYYYYVQLGRTCQAVGEELGIGKDRVSQLLKMFGLPVRKRGGPR